MESANNSLIVTNINITNNTYVIISPANIIIKIMYNECIIMNVLHINGE